MNTGDQINSFGSDINELINIHIHMWHKITKFKTINGNLRSNIKISPTERIRYALMIRELNSERSKLRWKIDGCFNLGVDETKINISGISND